MGWGDILTQVGTFALGPTAGAGISFASNFLKNQEAEKEAKAQKNSYYEALAQQKQLTQIAANTASQRAAFEQAMKDRILAQTGELGSTLRAAQTAMGAMPQYDVGRINQDYQSTKSTMMNDFTSMLKLVESQGRATQIDRLGGAGSTAADNDRMSALIKQYSPELQKIDDAAYDSAVSRGTNTMNLINTGRQNTLNELKGVISPQLDAEMNLLTQGGTDITNLMNSSKAYLNEAGDLATGTAAAAGNSATKSSASLGALLSQVYNKTSPAYTGSTADWESVLRRS